MTFSSLISFIAAAFSFALAVLVFRRDRQSFAHRIFAVGMAALSLEAVFTGISLLDAEPAEVVCWQYLRMSVTALIPGLWLLFSLTYARVNYKAFVRKYIAVIIGTFVIPIGLVSVFWQSFLVGEPVLRPPLTLLRLGWSGYLFHISLIISIVLLLMNLEKTLRGSVGHLRWQIKFMVLGIGGLFAVRLYADTQTVLFRSVNMELQLVNSVALLVVNILILRSLARARLFNVDFYVSQTFLYNSITLLIAGIYLLVVGVLAQAISYFSKGHSVSLNISLFFLVALGLCLLFLSDRLRRKVKRFVNVYLGRPQHDYRKEWTEFTRATTSVTDVKTLCTAIARKVSTTFDTLSVTIWLVDEKGEALICGGSTVFAGGQTQGVIEDSKTTSKLIAFVRRQQSPVDLYSRRSDFAKETAGADLEVLKRLQIRYCGPLRAGDSFLGFLALDGRVAGDPLSLEDYDLLKTIGDQTAGILLNFKLAEHLRQMKETEAYQTMSAFMMHDLKNLASNLSLTMQNMPIHFDNPDFRKDALRMIEQSVDKLNNMCSRLSMLSQKIELRPAETDLNALVRNSLPSLSGSTTVSLDQDLQALPKLLIDAEQMQKVLTNLILNAKEAIGDAGTVRVSSRQQGAWAILSVSDSGCGMSKEFIDRSLFRPFKTTKKQGMGIGLYQSKMIVEAHGGRIEVESEEGKGTTFRVYLPVGRTAKAE